MEFSRALLEGRATPLQLAALIRALLPAYSLLEQRAPALAAGLGDQWIPWSDLARRTALDHDVALLAALPATADSPAAAAWCARLQHLAETAPHRLMAHVYVRYGGDLSGGQQLAAQANRLLADAGLPALRFWAFAQPLPQLRQQLHDGFEQLLLSGQEEHELLLESELAFQLTQRLLAELAGLSEHPAPATAADEELDQRPL